MFQDERLMAIMNYLKIHKRISAEEICEQFGVSSDTARRDIVRLEEQGLIIRIRGGAILPTISKDSPSYRERLQQESSSKKAIGKAAAALIHDHDYLFFDASTTVRSAVEYMNTKRNVVVTNSIDTAGMLAEREDVTIHLLGGVIFNEHRFVYGAKTIQMLSEYHVDKLFIGTCGITLDGLSAMFEEESYLIREAMRRADQTIVLLDHTKFSKRLFHHLAGFEQIDTIVTDREPDEPYKEIMEQYGVEIILASGEE